MYPPIFSLKLPVVKARVPNQKRPREWRVGLKILGGRFSRSWTKRGDDANWLLMMLDRKNNEHTEERDGLWRKAKHTIFGYVCSDSFDAFREIKWHSN